MGAARDWGARPIGSPSANRRRDIQRYPGRSGCLPPRSRSNTRKLPCCRSAADDCRCRCGNPVFHPSRIGTVPRHDRRLRKALLSLPGGPGTPQMTDWPVPSRQRKCARPPHSTPWRSASHSFSARETFTGSSNSCRPHPRATNLFKSL